MTKRKSRWAGIIAAGLTALLLLAVYAMCGLFPCGSLSLGWGDMKQQIAPLFLQFRNILLGHHGFFLSLASGGMDFWGVFFFFLCSPFSLLVVLVQPEQIYRFLNVLVLLKLVTAAYCMGWFLLRRFPRMAVWHGGAVWRFLWLLRVWPFVFCQCALAGFGDPASLTRGSCFFTWCAQAKAGGLC